MREAERLTDAVAIALGGTVRAGRRRLGISQKTLGARVGVHQSWISRVELGRGQEAPLSLWIAIGHALGQPLAVSFSRPLGETRQPSDAGHLAMQDHLLGLARSTGRRATFELPTRPADPSHSIDVCVRDRRNRVVIIEEAWNTFGDIGAAVRSTHRKQAEAADLAAIIDDGPSYRVATVWVVRDSAANRALVHRFPEVFRAACPGSSKGWVEALTEGAAPPGQTGFVWFDPSTKRIRARRADVRPGRSVVR
jgi:transcriptional regulator with XRE-family HTH domain